MPLCCALVALAAWTFTQADSGALSPQAYVARLDAISQAIAKAATREEARAVAASVADRWTVRHEDLTIVVDLGWLDAAVAPAHAPKPWPSARQDIQTRLDAMRAEAAGPRVVHSRPPDAALAGVLARPEFQRTAASRWLDAVRRRVTEWIIRAIDRFTGRAIGSRTLAVRLAWIVALLALVALTGALVTGLVRRSGAERLDVTPAMPPRTPARDWALRALKAARAGDLREAIRCGYRGALCRLDEQGAWRVDDSRTPREYLRLLQDDDRRRPAVAALTRQFEQVWYGGRLTTDDDARQLTAHLETLGCLRAADRAI